MLRHFVAPVLVFGTLIVACSDSNHPAATVPEGGPLCPSNAKSAQGSACNRDGFSCAVGYQCAGGVWQQAACTCTNGKYACKDATGNDIMGDPQCTTVPPPADKCGASVTDMQGKSCASAGFACFFQGKTCPGENNDKPYTDACLCAPPGAGMLADGGPGPKGLYWNCEVKACGTQ